MVTESFSSKYRYRMYGYNVDLCMVCTGTCVDLCVVRFVTLLYGYMLQLCLTTGSIRVFIALHAPSDADMLFLPSSSSSPAAAISPAFSFFLASFAIFFSIRCFTTKPSPSVTYLLVRR